MTKLEPMSWASIGLSDSDNQAVWLQIKKQLSGVGFDQAGLAIELPMFEQTFPSGEHMLGNLVSPEWDSACCNANFQQINDVATPSSYGVTTYINPEKILASQAPASIKEGIGELYERGLTRGWTTPVRNLKRKQFATLILSTSSDGAEFDQLLGKYESSLQLCAAFLIEAMDLRRRIEQAQPRNLLSNRERECLSWASLGFSAKQIADKLKIAESTATEYLSHAAQKLGASNRAQAVARAVMLELIRP